MGKDVIPIFPIAEKILYLREQKVILDRDLARLYGVQTRVLSSHKNLRASKVASASTIRK